MSRRVVVAAGGTGGHLFPAAALAEVLRDRGWTARLLTDRRGAARRPPSAGVPCTVLPAAGMVGRSLGSRILAVPVLAAGAIRAVLEFRRDRPAVVVGFGGYASVPAGLAARVRRIPLVLHEANAVLGRANRMLAPHAQALATAFGSVAGVPPGRQPHQVGLPVRAAFERLAAVPYRPPRADGPVRLVVTGGSQGSRALDTIVPAALVAACAPLRRRFDVVQQVRRERAVAVEAAYRAAGIRSSVVPFVEDLADALHAAHLVIGRAGAATVAETAVAGRPAVYLPLPSAADGHQAANARAAAAAGAAWTVDESAGAPAVGALLAQVLAAPARLAAAAAAARRLMPDGAAGRLADLVEDASRGEGR